VQKKTLLLLLSLAVLFDFTGCVSMSAQDRREKAYRHYVQKQMKQRQKEIARAQKAANREMKRQMKSVQPSEPKVTATVEDVASESPSVVEPGAVRPASPSEPVVQPITVSASDSITTQNPKQPSQP